MKPKVDLQKLAVHVKLCRKNLKAGRVRCCATCPFEEFVVESYPELRELFEAKRRGLA